VLWCYYYTDLFNAHSDHFIVGDVVHGGPESDLGNDSESGYIITLTCCFLQ
jgi:hypothetical protein